MAGEAPGRAFAATWKNEQGETVGTTFGGTMCLWPNKPWRVRLKNGEFEVVARCRECPGCLEFDRRRLADRLYAKYGMSPRGCVDSAARATSASTTAPTAEPRALFVVRIWAPLELHAQLAHRLRRRPRLQLEPGMWRLGASSFAILARDAVSPRAALRAMGLRFRIEPLRLRRGRRAFRVLTAGLLVAREVYGEDVNRWYARGLPPAEQEKWEVQKLSAYKSYSRQSSPRAWTGRRVVLVPPEVWKLRRADRRALRGVLLRQPDPEGVAKVMRMVADTLRAQKLRSDPSAAPKALLTRDAVVRQYQRFAAKSSERAAHLLSDPDLTPSSEEGGYASSEHSQGELMPEQLAAAGRKDAAERRRRKLQWEAQEIIERMRLKSRGEG